MQYFRTKSQTRNSGLLLTLTVILFLTASCTEKKTAPTKPSVSEITTPQTAAESLATSSTGVTSDSLVIFMKREAAVFPPEFIVYTEAASPSESVLIPRGETLAIARFSDALHSLTDSLNLLLSTSLSPDDTALFRAKMRPINQIIYSRVPNPNAFPDSVFYLNIAPQPAIKLVKTSQKDASNGRTLYHAEFEARMPFSTFSTLYLARLKKFPEYYNRLKAHPLVRGLENSLGSVS